MALNQKQIQKYLAKWQSKRRLGLLDWKIEYELWEGPNSDPTANGACYIIYGGKHARIKIDSRLDSRNLEYLIAHEMLHIPLYELDDYLNATLPNRLVNSKVWNQGFNAAENKFIDFLLAQVWNLREHLDSE